MKRMKADANKSSIAYDLLATHRRLYVHERLLAPFLAEEGLTYNQVLLLIGLYYAPKCSISELASHIGGAQSNMSTLCTVMEKRGLVERIPYPLDERKISLQLTGTGEAKVIRLLHFFKESRWKQVFKEMQAQTPFA